MLTLYHAPVSRSTRLIRLAYELDIMEQLDIRIVSIRRFDGSGQPDSSNPHPEGKVPLLVHDGEMIWETAAIILYLTDLFPHKRFAPLSGEAKRGSYLSWLAYYGDVVEPTIVFSRIGLEHPLLHTTFRDFNAVLQRLSSALSDSAFLLGPEYSAADLLMSSPFHWFREAIPEDSVVRDWVERCATRPSMQAAADFDERQSAT
ncbi:glutathione S-transferase family protein [Rhodobacteraceae bacterium DSL-40]|uniref:glutathione S-transferase family protein n=1 Tax=Amaricoccus sp. B4 TaxID=3368557 RepID=UPI000DAEFCAD